jgi:predicted aspartyl protease
VRFFKLLCFSIVLFGPICRLTADDAATKASLQMATDVFQQGKFEEAEYRFAQLEKEITVRYNAALHLGALALYRNDLAAAEKHLKVALDVVPTSKQAKGLLINVYYRGDNFEEAAPLYRAVGDEIAAKKFESFKGLVPYQIDSKADVTRVPFVITDPLPLIAAKINGKPANLLIDTGAAELFIDPDLVKKANVHRFGETTRKGYAGGLSAKTGAGRIDSVTLGQTTIHNVPAQILNTRRFSAAAQGKRVDGVLGTSLLFHFLATIDYPKGELVLREKSREQLKRFEEQSQDGQATAMPFWMAGDHFMVTWGKVNRSLPLLFFVDTGLAGGGFVCPPSTLKDAGIDLPKGAEIEGVGGGGKVKAVAFMVDQLSLGGVEARQIQSFLGVFPPTLEHGEGFRIAGIVSHEFFRPYALTFDFQGMRLFIGRSKP